MWATGWVRCYILDCVVNMWRRNFNSLAPGKFEGNFRYVIFKWILVIAGWGISYEIALIWMSLDFTNDQSTLVQVMAWCRQATSHYLSQCWPRSLSPYGVTRPRWVKEFSRKYLKEIPCTTALSHGAPFTNTDYREHRPHTLFSVTYN